ncbi:uncharacterized protein LOC136092036 [Hydra vulgaris]|uniref:Uncharacterized protein LOC136092036 n=1 Tax=Hydra vulgaris TaxID=6087 RepID=A0ABM4DMN1_HYDVU
MGLSKTTIDQRKNQEKNVKWSDKLANELHRPVIKHFRKRKRIANGIDEIWAADLVDTQLSLNSTTHVKALGVELYSTENKEKSCVVERWNRTMKEKMFEYFSANSTRKYIDVLDEMKTTFEKGYTPRWTEEVFTISQIQYTDPPTYKITDNNGEKEIQGTFYEQELQKTNQEIFRIEKVIRKLKKKSLVKWYGYPESFN